MKDLFMDQPTIQRINEEIPRRSGNSKNTNIIKNKPFNGTNELSINGGKFRVDLDLDIIKGIIRPSENEDQGFVRESKRVSVECREKERVVNEPGFFACA